MQAVSSSVIAAIVWRRAGSGIEVYLVRRPLASAVLNGMWSMPGGVPNPMDLSPYQTLCRAVCEQTRLVLSDASKVYWDAGYWRAPRGMPGGVDVRCFLVQVDEHVRLDDSERVVCRAGMWITPANGLAGIERGTLCVEPPLGRVLHELADAMVDSRAFHDMAKVSERCVTRAAAEPTSLRMWELAAGIVQVPVRTPTLPPATHTNCWVIGSGDVVVIDPATPDADEQDVLLSVLASLQARGRRVRAVCLTHHHQDHVGAVMRIARELSVPVAAHRLTASLVAPFITVDRYIEDGEILELPGIPARRLETLFTPGHAPGHLCFQELETGWLIAGDMVAGVGSILIDPCEGDMAKYMASLMRMRMAKPQVLLPAHGHAIVDADATLSAYLDHRLWRQERVFDALLDLGGRATVVQLVPRVYTELPATWYPLAERSLMAHLQKLTQDGRVTRDGSHWMI